MPAHTSVDAETHRHVHKLFELGLPSFWLLGSILAVLLALIGFVFLLAWF